MFRGRSQTRGDPAAQAGIGYQHHSGLFGGIWASNVDYNPVESGEFELDYIAFLAVSAAATPKLRGAVEPG